MRASSSVDNARAATQKLSPARIAVALIMFGAILAVWNVRLLGVRQQDLPGRTIFLPDNPLLRAVLTDINVAQGKEPSPTPAAVELTRREGFEAYWVKPGTMVRILSRHLSQLDSSERARYSSTVQYRDQIRSAINRSRLIRVLCTLPLLGIALIAVLARRHEREPLPPTIQVAGMPCSVCSQKITTILDGTGCAMCQKAYHYACISGTKSCPTCGLGLDRQSEETVIE